MRHELNVIDFDSNVGDLHCIFSCWLCQFCKSNNDFDRCQPTMRKMMSVTSKEYVGDIERVCTSKMAFAPQVVFVQPPTWPMRVFADGGLPTLPGPSSAVLQWPQEFETFQSANGHKL